jgi:hypothetical protein
MLVNFFALVLLLAVVVNCAPGKKGKKDKNENKKKEMETKRVFDSIFNNRVLPLLRFRHLLLVHPSMKVQSAWLFLLWKRKVLRVCKKFRR